MTYQKDIDQVLDLFAPTSAKAVERLLRRAAEKELRTIRKGGRRPRDKAPEMTRAAKALAGGLGRSLGKAMQHRGMPKRQAPSIRQTAPIAADGSGGGRPFHFRHSVVTKGGGNRGSGKATATDGPEGSIRSEGAGQQGGKAASHMRYIERETAVERSPIETEKDRAGRDPDDVGFDREVSEGRSNDAPGMGSGGAGQRYIENPVKLANGENVVFSFGTIGKTFDERLHFWEALEQHEPHPGARVQNRLIVELPHEASPQARYEMVKEFCKRFEADGAPYWAALHAPGKDNDHRNFHAHIVFSERRAKRMVDKADGVEKWDFEITEEYIKKSRNRVTRHPHRLNRIREYNAKSFVGERRQEFCSVVNAVLDREKVVGRDGRPVRYDARSYADMGLDVVPARSINRIVADKAKDGPLLVQDAGWTKKMVRQELTKALAERDAGTMEVIRLDDVFREAAAKPFQAQRLNARLPREMRIPAGAMPTRAALKAAGDRIVSAKRDALRIDLVERSTRTALDLVVAATDPEALSATRRKIKDPGRLAELPDAAHAALLREAALEEFRVLDADTAAGRTAARLKLIHAVAEWRAAVVPPTSVTSPAMLKIIADVREPKIEFGRRVAAPNEGLDVEKRSVARSPTTAEVERKAPRRAPRAAKASIDAMVPKPPSPPSPQTSIAAEYMTASARTSGVIKELWKLPTPAARIAMLDAILEAAAQEAQRRSPEPPGGEVGRNPTPAATAAAPASPAKGSATKAAAQAKTPDPPVRDHPASSPDKMLPSGQQPPEGRPSLPSEAEMKASEEEYAARLEKLRKKRKREEEKRELARLRRKAILAKGRGR